MTVPVFNILNFNLTEQIDKEISTASGQHSWLHRQESLVFIAPFANERDYIAGLLGYAYCYGSNLCRVNPLQHPRFPELRCTAITNITRKSNNAKTAVPKLTAPNAKQQEFTCGYKYSWITAEFSSLDYTIAEDIQKLKEYNRNVNFTGDGGGD